MGFFKIFIFSQLIYQNLILAAGNENSQTNITWPAFFKTQQTTYTAATLNKFSKLQNSISGHNLDCPTPLTDHTSQVNKEDICKTVFEMSRNLSQNRRNYAISGILTLMGGVTGRISDSWKISAENTDRILSQKSSQKKSLKKERKLNYSAIQDTEKLLKREQSLIAPGAESAELNSLITDALAKIQILKKNRGNIEKQLTAIESESSLVNNKKNNFSKISRVFKYGQIGFAFTFFSYEAYLCFSGSQDCLTDLLPASELGSDDTPVAYYENAPILLVEDVRSNKIPKDLACSIVKQSPKLIKDFGLIKDILARPPTKEELQSYVDEKAN